MSQALAGEIIDRRPCDRCGSQAVTIPASRCSSCGSRNIRPHPGPQSEFFRSSATVIFYGGTVGGGKSAALLLDALRYATAQDPETGRWLYPGWTGVIFRHRAVDIKGDDAGLWQEAHELFEGTGAAPRAGSMMDMQWRGGASQGGATLLFRHLAEANFEHYRGRFFAWIGIDEALELDLRWITFMLTRNRSKSGAPLVLRMTGNPDPDHPLLDLVRPYLDPEGYPDRRESGRVRWIMRSRRNNRLVIADTRAEVAELADDDPVLAKSFTFIASRLADNPSIDSPEYRASLAILEDWERDRLEGGCWFSRRSSTGMLRRGLWGSAVLSRPLAPIVRRVRGWDKGATAPNPKYPDPDFTAGTRLAWDIHGRVYVDDLAACRRATGERDVFMAGAVRRDGPEVIQVQKEAPGDAGKDAVVHTGRVLAAGEGGVAVKRETKAKTTRLEPMAEALRLGMDGDTPVTEKTIEAAGEWGPRFFILDETGWTLEPYDDGGPAPTTLLALFWSQVDPFPDAAHDDIPDAMGDAYAVGSETPRRLPPGRRARALTRR